uniref:Tyr recombinase domain-containing protein n=1 Tax=Pristionchus pacificus TaxID=54126 RepID=A0A8R1UYA6_PRIPA
MLPVSSAASLMPSNQSSLPFVNSPLSSGVHSSMAHLPTGQSHLELLVSALKPHFVAPSPISHTIPRVKNGETQEIIASLVEAANEAEKVKVGRGSIDTVISLILERIQVLVVQETSPGFADSLKGPPLSGRRWHGSATSGSSHDNDCIKLQLSPFHLQETTTRATPTPAATSPLLPSTRNSRASIAINADTRAPNALFPLEGKGIPIVAFENVKSAIAFWEQIGDSDFVLRTIQEGYRILVPSHLSTKSFHFSDNRVMSSVDADFVAKQLIEWLQSGAIVEAKADEELAVFPLTVAKNDTIEELARGVGWIRHDLEQAGMNVNEEKSKFLPAQSGEESSLHSRYLQQTVARMEDEGIRSIEVSQLELGELQYWKGRMEHGISRGIAESKVEADWELTSDASAFALGWVLEGRLPRRGARNLSEQERACSSTMRELLGICFAISSVAETLHGDSILVRCDNQGAISILRKGRERGAMMEELEEDLKRAGRSDLIEMARFAMEKSVAPSTLKAYAAADRARRRLASACGLEEEADFSLCLYVLDAMRKRRSKSTVATALAAFGFVSGEDPRASRFGPLLGAALKTAARTVPTSNHDKATRESIEKLNGVLGASKADLRIAVLSLISFGALLRPSEAVGIRRDSVAIKIGEEESLIIGNYLLLSRRTTFFSLNSGSSGRIAWNKYFQTVITAIPSPFFFPSFTEATKGMTTDFVRKEMKRACVEAGVTPFTPHCLRGGGATTSIEEGTPVEQVRMRGRWNSSLGIAPYLADSVKTQGGTLSL